MILDTNALSAYLDRTAKAVEIVSEAPEIAIPVIVAESLFTVSRSRGTVRRTNVRYIGCWIDAPSLTLELTPRGTTQSFGWN